MANNIFLERDDACTPKGWSPWLYVKDVDNSTSEPISFQDAPLPENQLPSKAFWLESVISHCCSTWKFNCDPNKDNTEDETCYEKEKNVYGIGLGFRETPATFCRPDYDEYEEDLDQYPQFGYCLNAVFKQHIYCHLRLEEFVETDSCTGFSQAIHLKGEISPQVMQNSRLKRLIVHQGKILGYFYDQTKKVDVFITDLSPDDIYEEITFDESIEMEVGSLTVNLKKIRENGFFEFDFKKKGGTSPQAKVASNFSATFGGDESSVALGGIGESSLLPKKSHKPPNVGSPPSIGDSPDFKPGNPDHNPRKGWKPPTSKIRDGFHPGVERTFDPSIPNDPNRPLPPADPNAGFCKEPGFLNEGNVCGDDDGADNRDGRDGDRRDLSGITYPQFYKLKDSTILIRDPYLMCGLWQDYYTFF